MIKIFNDCVTTLEGNKQVWDPVLAFLVNNTKQALIKPKRTIGTNDITTGEGGDIISKTDSKNKN